MRNRLGVVATAVAVLALSACGSSGGNGGAGSSTSPSESPSASASESATTSRAPSSTAAPKSWGAAAESVCRQIFSTRGSPEQTDSEDLDDQMAADAFWAAHLQDVAATRLAALPGKSAYGTILISDMKYAHTLNQDMGSIYLEHPLFSSRLDQDEANFAQLEKDVAQLTDYLDAPSCYKIAKQTAPVG